MQNVDKNLLPTSTQKQSAVPDNARLNFVGIKSIKKVGKEPIYNLTVDEFHNYIVNDGIVVKNCDTDRYVLYTESLCGMSGVYN